jgi:arylsulfatase A-like enzyme
LAEGSTNKLPNIIFMLVDDLGWADTGCYGSTFHETPHVDGFAKSAMRFTQAYAASPVCSPTRASILTGKYPARIGFTRATPTHSLPLEELTLAEALKEEGYRTAHAGKWHLQIYRQKGRTHFPEAHGFDVNIAGHCAGAPGSFFFPYTNPRFKNNSVPDMEDGKDGDYLTDALTTKAIKFMKESKDMGKPFFLNMWFYSVHTPVQAKKEKIEKFEKKLEKMGLEASGEAYFDQDTYHRGRQDNPTYAAMVESLDENVGRILNFLKEQDMEDETIVVFTSDNGGLSSHRESKGGVTSSLPLRGGKAWVYEGGIREPLIIRWPGKTKAGSVNNTPVISTDFYPTLLDMIGAEPRAEQHLDGISITPILKNEQASLARETFYFHFPHNHAINRMGASGAIRHGKYKLVEKFSDMSVELFNLENDLGEKKDLSKENPELTVSLTAMLHEWRESVHAMMPEPKKMKP